MCMTIGFGLNRGKQPTKSHGNNSEINNIGLQRQCCDKKTDSSSYEGTIGYRWT